MARDKDKNPEKASVAAEERPNTEEVKDAIIEEIDDGRESEGDVTLSKEEFELAREEIAKLRLAMDSAILDALRLQAEFNNYRKRNASLRTDSLDEGARETIKAMLPVLDNFDRAMAAADESAFAKGIEQIRKQFIETLQKSGLEEIPAEGSFDPNLHDAVIRDDEGEGESGTITAVLQKGYMVKGRIIRHTMVKVKS